MTDIVAADVTYTLVSQGRDGGPRHNKRNRFNLVFGDNSLAYPTGGVPLTKAKLGCPNVLYTFVVIDQGANAKGYTFEWDSTNNKLVVTINAGTVAAPTFTGSALTAHGHVLHLNNAEVADNAGNRVNAAAGLIGANTGADIDIAAVADVSSTGGIVSITAGTPAGTNSAPAFTGTFTQHANATFVPNPATLLVEVTGY